MHSLSIMRFLSMGRSRDATVGNKVIIILVPRFWTSESIGSAGAVPTASERIHEVGVRTSP